MPARIESSMGLKMAFWLRAIANNVPWSNGGERRRTRTRPTQEGMVDEIKGEHDRNDD